MPRRKRCSGMRPARSALNPEPVIVRCGSAEDLAAVAEIQAASSEAAQWDVREYLTYEFIVALCGERLAGFAVARRLSEGESELLNLAVDPHLRRCGIGSRLIGELTSRNSGSLWLEVRESNFGARNFYKRLGFSDAGRRADYYQDSGEAAIVMNFHSC